MRETKDQFEISALPENAAVARARVKKTALAVGFDTVIVDDLEIAIGEAVTNAILYGAPHANSPITIQIYFDSDRSVFGVEIRDQGRGFDPNYVRQAESADSLGGRGLRLMRALTDSLLLYYDGDGMVVRLEKKLPH